MQELIGYYIPMEEYYMRESVNKVHFGDYCNAHCVVYVHVLQIVFYFTLFQSVQQIQKTKLTQSIFFYLANNFFLFNL